MEKGINAAANDDDQVDSTKYRVGVQWEPVKKNQYSVSIQLEPIKKKLVNSLRKLSTLTSFIAYFILMEKGTSTAANDDDQVNKTRQMESI